MHVMAVIAHAIVFLSLELRETPYSLAIEIDVDTRSKFVNQLIPIADWSRLLQVYRISLDVMVCHSEENKGISVYLYFLQSLFLNILLLHQIQSLSCVDFSCPLIMPQTILASDIKLKSGCAK